MLSLEMNPFPHFKERNTTLEKTTFFVKKKSAGFTVRLLDFACTIQIQTSVQFSVIHLVYFLKAAFFCTDKSG